MCVYARFVHVESVTNVTSSRRDTSHPAWHPCNSRSACLFAAEGTAPFALSAEKEPAARFAQQTSVEIRYAVFARFLWWIISSLLDTLCRCGLESVSRSGPNP